MAVGTESIFVPHTFGPVLSVISITFDDLPQRADTYKVVLRIGD